MISPRSSASDVLFEAIQADAQARISLLLEQLDRRLDGSAGAAPPPDRARVEQILHAAMRDAAEIVGEFALASIRERRRRASS